MGEQIRMRSKTPPVADHHALRNAGRARRIEQEHRVVGAGSRARIGCILAVPPGFEGLVAGMPAHHEDLLHAGEIGFHLVEYSDEFLADHEESATGIGDHRRDLTGSEAPVDSRLDRVDLGCSVQEIEELETVLVQEADVILGADALGDEPVRHPIRALVQFRVGHGFAVLDQRSLAGLGRGVGADYVSDGLGGHGWAPLPSRGQVRARMPTPAW